MRKIGLDVDTGAFAGNILLLIVGILIHAPWWYYLVFVFAAFSVKFKI